MYPKYTRFPTVAETPIFDDFCFLAVSAAVFLIFSGLVAWCLGKHWINSHGIEKYVQGYYIKLSIKGILFDEPVEDPRNNVVF